MYDEIEELSPEYKNNRKHKILSELDDIIEYEDSQDQAKQQSNPDISLPSMFIKEKKKKDEVDSDEWFQTLMDLRVDKPKKSRAKNLFDLDDYYGEKKKKKKKDKKKGTDYQKEFEKEMALYRNLLIDQNKFTDSLQREYDAMTSRKSSARGINKAITDLVQNITSARQLSMQLVEKTANIKKTVADLTMKERKENKEANGAENNMADFASSYLKQIVNERQSVLAPNTIGDIEVGEFTDDEISSYIADSLSDTERPDEVNQYLKYESRNVKIYVLMNPEDVDDYEFIAKDEDGVEIPDYPLPYHTKMSINRSTSIATDVYGEKYHIIWK